MDNASLLSTPTPYGIWIFFCGAVGAGTALFLNRKWFGGFGRVGVRRFLVGIPIVTLTAALVAGTLALPFYGTMFGLLAIMGTFVETPFLAVLWLSCLAGTHWSYMLYEKERESIFVPMQTKPKGQRA